MISDFTSSTRALDFNCPKSLAVWKCPRLRSRQIVAPADFAFSGAKQSGFGVELGDEGLRSYTEATVVCD